MSNKKKGPTPKRKGNFTPHDPVSEERLEMLGPQTMAAIDMIGRTGASNFQIRYSDDEQPVVWMAIADYESEEGTAWECAAGHDPDEAISRLCETLIDGATCTHCKRPAGFDPDRVPEEMPMDELFCWYQFDPELKTYRRGCEGS